MIDTAALVGTVERHWAEHGRAITVADLHEAIGRPDVGAFKVALLALHRTTPERTVVLCPWGRHRSELAYADLCPVVTVDRDYLMAYVGPADRSV